MIHLPEHAKRALRKDSRRYYSVWQGEKKGAHRLRKVWLLGILHTG